MKDVVKTATTHYLGRDGKKLTEKEFKDRQAKAESRPEPAGESGQTPEEGEEKKTKAPAGGKRR